MNFLLLEICLFFERFPCLFWIEVVLQNFTNFKVIFDFSLIISLSSKTRMNSVHNFIPSSGIPLLHSISDSFERSFFVDYFNHSLCEWSFLCPISSWSSISLKLTINHILLCTKPPHPGPKLLRHNSRHLKTIPLINKNHPLHQSILSQLYCLTYCWVFFYYLLGGLYYGLFYEGAAEVEVVRDCALDYWLEFDLVGYCFWELVF